MRCRFPGSLPKYRPRYPRHCQRHYDTWCDLKFETLVLVLVQVSLSLTQNPCFLGVNWTLCSWCQRGDQMRRCVKLLALCRAHSKWLMNDHFNLSPQLLLWPWLVLFGGGYLLMGGFSDGSSGKESTCNARDIRDAGSIPVLGRSPGEGNGSPL